MFNLCKQLEKHLSQIEKAISWKPAGNSHGNFPHAVAILKIPPCNPTILMINSGTVFPDFQWTHWFVCSAACIRRGSKKESFTTFSSLHSTNNLSHFPLEIQGFLQLAGLTNVTGREMFLWLSSVLRCSCKNELEPALFFTNYPELLCSGHSTHTMLHEPSEDVLNITETFCIYLWHSVLVWAWWIVPLTFAEEGRSCRGSLGRGFPRASRNSVWGDSHHTKSVQPVVWWAAVQVQASAGVFPKTPVP